MNVEVLPEPAPNVFAPAASPYGAMMTCSHRGKGYSRHSPVAVKLLVKPAGALTVRGMMVPAVPIVVVPAGTNLNCESLAVFAR